ncbi:MAG TPA: hypothetical protein VMY05_04245 [Acidobacteriota bacterium]|nr:hypothetical protein [Acidobacteriota bacterium]
MKKHLIVLLLLAPALAVYAGFAYHFDFYQDDAYISYRYVANYVNGDGLVYNVGEHVEGYTNFGWVAYLLLWGAMGADYLLVSKITGFLLGWGIILVGYLTARLVFGERQRWFAVGAAYLVGLNQSLAYWSPAGLETAAFAFCAVLSLYLYLKQSWLLTASLAYAVLLRPEGAMLAGLLILIEFVQLKKLPLYTIVSSGIALLLLVPYVAFKLLYYGSILPNPFYAKTSFDFTQLSNGLEYTGRFLSHYGFYGVSLAVPLIFWRRLHAEAKAVWLYTVIYSAYVVLIGGDVLKVHRFFLPVTGTVAVLTLLPVALVTHRLRGRNRRVVLCLVMVPLLALTYWLPRGFVEYYNFQEKAFTAKMQYKAREMKKADATNFSVALGTIGIFGYELIGHQIIDMLGLTDSTIARYSEKPIEGMQTTWKEQKHNSRYLLERAPDYIIFSTGIKPSAPAEKALLLYSQFLSSYRTVAWYYQNPEVSSRGIMSSAFKRVRPVEGEIVPTYPLEYVENFKLGLEAHVRGDQRAALRYYDRALQVSPEPYNTNLLYQKAFSLLVLRQDNLVEPILNSILQQDSLVYEAHRELYLFSISRGDTRRAVIHRRWLQKLVPWYLPRLDSIAAQSLGRPVRRP